MTDTPANVKKMQLEIWLSKTPEQRLLQAIADNEAQLAFWKDAKEQLTKAAKSEKRG